jgi:hypothetical protein
MSVIRLRAAKAPRGFAPSRFAKSPEEGQVRLLRRQRRLALIGAIVGLVLGVVASLPASLLVPTTSSCWPRPRARSGAAAPSPC